MDEAAEGGRVVSWTTAMTNFMLKHLVDLVASGARTSSGFKRVHYNGCAKALNEHFRLNLNGGQVSNRYKTVRKKFEKIQYIQRKVSGALWDEDKCMIIMEHNQAIDHINSHKGHAEYINRPIENYKELEILYGNRLATGKNAKGSGEPLGNPETSAADEDEVEAEEGDGEGDVATTNSNTQAESSATKPSKRAKTSSSVGDDEGLIATLGKVGSELAKAITAAGEKSAPTSDDVPEELYPTLMSFPGFNEAHIALYFAYLVENPRLARAFMKMSSVSQLTWISSYISGRF